MSKVLVDRKVLEQALEALESVNYANYSWACVEAVTALKAALEQSEQTQDSTCNNTLRAQGKAYPRTCKKCGFGPCIADRVQPKQEQPTGLQRFAASVDELGMDYERACCNVRTSVLCPEQVQAQPEQDGSLIDEGSRQQEPVAWLRREELADLQTCNYRHLGADSPRIWAPHQPDAPDPEQDMVPVYTHPPRREWRGLTDEDLEAKNELRLTRLQFARAIEDKLKEKNHE